MSSAKPVTAQAARQLRSVDPATGELLRTYAALAESEITLAIARSHDAFRSYRRTAFSERAAILTRAADILDDEKEQWGELMSREMGKLRHAGIAEAQKCARACRFYAEHGERFLADQSVASSARTSFVAFQPLGPILAVMPWNFPFWQVFRAAVPALMAGNTMLLKHASNVPQCALAIQDILHRAGVPQDAFQTLLIGSSQVPPVIADVRVRGVTLTGSDTAGEDVATHAGHHLKKVVLELGGSDPFIVMPSVDLDHTVQMAVSARIINNGQSCIAAKRFIVHDAIADAFEQRFVAAMKSLRIGDPLDPQTQLGPLATPAIRDRLAEQVEKSVRAGARVLTGGNKLVGPGNYYEPTVLASIPKESPAYREELFGPVASLFRARDLAEAIEIANDTTFGLGASLWTKERSEEEIFIREIEAGVAFVNKQVASDPPLPFGGIKRSGFGRELGELGIREFTNIKTVVIEPHAAD